MQKLKPCPFCGGADIVTQRGQKQRLCMGCGAEGPEEKNRREAHDAWNRRTPDPSAVYNACMQAAASFVERKATIEPMTSIVKWTRYDGTPETEPAKNREVIAWRDEKYGWLGSPYDMTIGDKWAYWPGPPENVNP